MKFFIYFFAEFESLWSQGPVIRNFWKSYLIRPRYSTFKHFCVSSASDEIVSSYAQPAMKYFPHMLSQRWNLFHVCSAYFEWWFWNGLWFFLKGTVQPELRWVKIGINRTAMKICVAGKCRLSCPKGHHHERNINILGGCAAHVCTFSSSTANLWESYGSHVY